MSFVAAYDHFCAKSYAVAKRMIAPGVRNSHYAYADALRSELQRQGVWLDIGCGHDFLPPWMAPNQRALATGQWRIGGIDLDRTALMRHCGLRLRVHGNIEQLPFRDNSFDLITANMVVEHVADPERLFREIARVLRRKGRLLVHTPNGEGYTTRLTRMLPDSWLKPLASILLGRAPEDVYPTFYRANSRDALTEVAALSGMSVASLECIHSSPQLMRIPPLMAIELVLTRWFDRESMQRHRACLLAVFEKPDRP